MIIGSDACENCKFFFVDKNAQKCCRRIPPSVHPIIAQGPAGPQMVGAVSAFPNVQVDQWCGEHVRKVIRHAND